MSKLYWDDKSLADLYTLVIVAIACAEIVSYPTGRPTERILRILALGASIRSIR